MQSRRASRRNRGHDDQNDKAAQDEHQQAGREDLGACRAHGERINGASPLWIVRGPRDYVAAPAPMASTAGRPIMINAVTRTATTSGRMKGIAARSISIALLTLKRPAL